MKKNLKIGVDIDDTIAVLIKEYFKQAKLYDKSLRNTGVIKKCGRLEQMFDWSHEEFLRFNQSCLNDIVPKLKPVKGSAKVLNKLKNMGCEIYIITARADRHFNNSQTVTEQWLNKYKFPYKELICQPDGEADIDKVIFAKSLNLDLFIDDHFGICKDMVEAGIKTFLFTSPTNKDMEVVGAERVFTWKEIYINIVKKAKNAFIKE